MPLRRPEVIERKERHEAGKIYVLLVFAATLDEVGRSAPRTSGSLHAFVSACIMRSDRASNNLLEGKKVAANAEDGSSRLAICEMKRGKLLVKLTQIRRESIAVIKAAVHVAGDYLSGFGGLLGLGLGVPVVSYAPRPQLAMSIDSLVIMD